MKARSTLNLPCTLKFHRGWDAGDSSAQTSPLVLQSRVLEACSNRDQYLNRPFTRAKKVQFWQFQLSERHRHAGPSKVSPNGVPMILSRFSEQHDKQDPKLENCPQANPKSTTSTSTRYYKYCLRPQ